MMSEAEFYDGIFAKYTELSHDSNKTELWKNQAIIELMNLLNDKRCKNVVKNGLLIVMALFDDYLNDTFYIKTKNICDITRGKRSILVSLLKEELFSEC